MDWFRGRVYIEPEIEYREREVFGNQRYTTKVVFRITPGGLLAKLGFQVEASKKKVDKLQRPVFFGENGIPTLRYEIDGYHPQWKCGLEVEAGRGWMGNAVYRDLVQAAVMVGVEHLCLAVANVYRYKTSGRPATSTDYEKTKQLAEAIYGHSRLRLPYNLVLVGY